MKWTRRDTLSASIIIVLVGSFFVRLFWPTPQLIVTPDFGRSDAWNFSFATKYFLGQQLHARKLPLWSATIGDGFPLYAEGQTGTFFLPNLVFFSVFNPVTAYNLALVVSVLTAAIGMFVWLKVLGFRSIVAICFGVTIGLSGVTIAQLTHITLLQAFTLMPIIMAFTHLAAVRPSWKNYAVLSMLIGQQTLTGFPQGVFVTLCFSVPYFVVLIWKKEQKIMHIARYVAALVFALFLGAVQLIPSYEFLKQIVTADGFSVFSAAQYSFPLSHVRTFLHPFALGNPKFGTYAYPQPYAGSIFWENSGYIGILPLLCLPFAFIRKHSKHTLIVFFSLTAIAAFLLMLGRNSPLYILFSFWPFNLFRVPSRFIWIFDVSLLLLAAYGLTRILHFIHKPFYQYALITLFLMTQTLMLEMVWWDYHQLEFPIVSHETENTKTYGLGLSGMYVDRFIREGWQDMKPYDLLQTSLLPDANLLTGIASHDVYAGRQLRRGALLDSILLSQIQQDEKVATVSAEGQKLLDMMGVTTVFSSTPITDAGLTLTETRSQQPFRVYVYENRTAVPRVYLTSSAVTATTKEEAQQQFFDDSFTPGHTVLLEEHIPMDTHTNDGKATIIKQTDTTVGIRVTDHPSENILVLSDTFYPGWGVSIDGKPARILPANISYRAVVVPAGDHTIVFSYQPKTFMIGAWISALTWILIICLTGFPLVFAVVRTVLEALSHARYHRGNRGR